MNIDEMKAGPELDRLACEALGIDPEKSICGYCRSCKKIFAYCRCDSFRGGVVYPPISTDAAAMVAAMKKCDKVEVLTVAGSFLVLVEKHGAYYPERVAVERTMPLAFARAAAKTKEREREEVPACPHCGESGPFAPQGFCQKGHRQQ